MPFKVVNQENNVLCIKVSGKIADRDYKVSLLLIHSNPPKTRIYSLRFFSSVKDVLVPTTDALLESHARIRLLIDVREWSLHDGVTIHAMYVLNHEINILGASLACLLNILPIQVG